MIKKMLLSGQKIWSGIKIYEKLFMINIYEFVYDKTFNIKETIYENCLCKYL